jgi:flagellar assembly protein FliH
MIMSEHPQGLSPNGDCPQLPRSVASNGDCPHAGAVPRVAAFRPMLERSEHFRPMLGGGVPRGGVADLYAQGLAEGQELAAAAFAAERAQLLGLIAGADGLKPEGGNAIAELITAAVEQLTRSIIEAAPIEADWLAARAKEMAAIISEADGARTLRLNPDDAALLADSPIALPIIPDPALPRGELRIDCAAGAIEHGRASMLERLNQTLGEQA